MTDHSDSRQVRVAFLIRSLNRGGSEHQLAELVTGLDSDRFQILVLTFYGGGAVEERLKGRANVEVISLGKTGRWELCAFTWRLAKMLRAWKPDILHCWLVEPSVFGLIAARLARVPAVIWSIRASYMDFTKYGRVQALTFNVAAVLSRFATMLIANSERGREYHAARGYCTKRFAVIANGIDVDRFSPSATSRTATRASWGLSADAPVIGFVARLDPMKDHVTFLKAAAILVTERSEVHVVCVGGGDLTCARVLSELVRDLGIDSRVRFVDEHPLPESLYPAFDVACSSSYGEGFSNSVAEAMACGVPCVVTDVGDSAYIVGDTGIVVDARDVVALSNGLRRIIELDGKARLALGSRARERIVRRFSVDRMLAETARVYEQILDERTPHAGRG